MLAGFRIVFDVVVYRLRKMEMLNGAGAISIAVALHLAWLDIAIRALFVLGLNALVYLNNDYADIQIDLNSSDKDAGKSRFLAEHLKAAFWAQWSLVGLLTLAALIYDPGLFVPLITGGGICWWYSVQLKHRPGLDVLAMVIWGMAMPLFGTPITRATGILMALQLGLFSGVFETIQVMRDADEDAAEGVRTTGVVLGKRRSLILAKVIMVASTAYAALVLQPWAAAVSLIALVLPFSEQSVERYWTRVKLVYGFAWLVICAWIFWHGQRAGLIG